MNIECIDEEIINYGKNTYFYSDSYLRKLKIYNTSFNEIEDMFSKCYQIYYELRYRDYRVNRDSQIFLENTIDKIENSNISFFNKRFPPKRSQKSGLIHILANDNNMDVRWGDKECE